MALRYFSEISFRTLRTFPPIIFAASSSEYPNFIGIAPLSLVDTAYNFMLYSQPGLCNKLISIKGRDLEEITMSENDWHETKIRVRYKDTDRMGVVYYGNYLTYFEIGRAELMRDLGFPYSTFESDGYILVVIEANAKYHSNVGYDTLVTVKTKITDLRLVRVSFKYEIVDEQYGLLVSGYTVHACINSNSKPMKIPPELRKIMAENLKT